MISKGKVPYQFAAIRTTLKGLRSGSDYYKLRMLMRQYSGFRVGICTTRSTQGCGFCNLIGNLYTVQMLHCYQLSRKSTLEFKLNLNDPYYTLRQKFREIHPNRKRDYKNRAEYNNVNT